jgi:peptide/nickel transport system substrate-binding protein
MKKTILVIGILAVCLMSGTLGDCASGDKPPAGGKAVYIGLVNPPVTFNPINLRETTSRIIASIFFESLLELTGPNEFAPRLAKKFTTQNKQVYTVELDPRARWSDGKPVTAHDVAFTLNLAAHPKVETALGTFLAQLAGLDDNGKLPPGQTVNPNVKVVNDLTLQFTAKRPTDPNMIKEFIGTRIFIAPKHDLEKISPEELVKHPFAMNPTVTSGAFSFVRYEKNQYVELKANPDYYRGKPKLDRLFIKIVPATNLLAQMQRGEIDMNMAQAVGLFPLQDYDAVKKLPNVRTWLESTHNYQVLMFNTEKIPDAKVRRAMVHAIDRQKIVERLFQGTADIVDGPYTKLSSYLDPKLKRLEFDPDMGRQMLKEAGWDGARVLKMNVPLGNKAREQSADMIVQNLDKIGMKVQIATHDFPTHMVNARSGNFDLLLMGMPGFVDPNMEQQYQTKAQNNFMRYSSAECDTLLAQGKAEPDPAKRKLIYNKLQQIWNTDVPLITLYSPQDLMAVSRRVKVGEPRTFGMFYNLHEWEVE